MVSKQVKSKSIAGVPPVNKEHVEKMLDALFERDVIPEPFYVTYQVMAIISLLMEKDVLGEVANNVAHQLARFFVLADVRIDEWTQDLVNVYKVYHAKFAEKQKELLQALEKQAREQVLKQQDK